MKINKGIAVMLAATILTTGGGLAASVATATPAEAASSQSEIDAAVNQIWNATNAERAKQGLAPLRLTPAINTVAQKWSQQMAADRAMYHSPSFQYEIPANWSHAGENVAQGYNPSTVVPAWMASEGHRLNILGEYTHIGIGYWVDETGRAWFTQNFGEYETVEAPSAPNTPTSTVDRFNFTSNWTAKLNEYVTNYQVELRSSTGELLQSKTVNYPTVSFATLSENTDYTVQITARAIDATGLTYSSPVTTYNVKTKEDLPVVTAPNNLTLTPGENSMTTTWTAPSTVYGALQPYTVEIKKGTTVVATAETTSTNYIFNNLTSNTGYTVNVTASTTLKSKVAVATATKVTKTALSSVAAVTEPQNVNVSSPSHSSITANWTAPSSATGIDLRYRITLIKDGQTLQTTDTNQTSDTFSGLESNSAYTVKVQALITSENMQKEAISTGVTKNTKTLINYDEVSVTNPSFRPSQVSPRQVALSWTAPEKVVGEFIDYTITVKSAGKADRTINTNLTSYTVTGLLENTNYTFELKANAKSLNGKNLQSSTTVSTSHVTPYAADTVIVSAPRSLSTVAANYSQINASWTAPEQVVGSLNSYSITLKKGETVVSTKTTTGLTTSFTGLEDSTAYTIEVKALADSPDRTKTATSTITSSAVTTPAHAAAPNAVTELKATNVTHNEVTLNWGAPTGVYGTISGYTVTVKEAGKADRAFTSTSNTYKITGLTENTSVTAQVVANVVSKDGTKTATSPFANVELKTSYAPNTVKVNAPTGLNMSNVTYRSMDVAWAAPTGTVGTLTGYMVTVKEGNVIVSSKTVTGLTANFTGLDDGTNYTVEVIALAVAADQITKGASVPVIGNVTTPSHAEASNSPTNLKANSVTHNEATVSWNTPSGIYGKLTNYTITLKEAGKANRVFTSESNSYKITGLNENTNYVVEIAANVSSNDSTKKVVSPLARVELKTSYAPSTVMVSAPKDLKLASITADSMKASWSAPTDVVGDIDKYIITVRQGTAVKATYTTTGTNFAISGLNADSSYTVEIRAIAVSADETKSATSSPVSSTATTSPEAAKVASPVAKVTNIGSDRATVSWNAPEVTGNITNYVVSVKQGSTVVKTITVKSNVTATEVSGLVEDTAYSVVVEVNATRGQSTATASSTPQNFTTILSEDSKAAISQVGSLAVTSTHNEVSASWKAPTSVTGKQGSSYRAILTDSNGKWVKNYYTKSTTAKFTGLKESSSYRVYVRAYVTSNNGENKTSSQTGRSTKTTVNPDTLVAVSPVSSFKLTSTHNAVAATWTAPKVTGQLSPSYRVILADEKGKWIKNYYTKSTSGSFTGLKENTSYKVFVRAYATSNDGKNSERSVTSGDFQTTGNSDSTAKATSPTALAVTSTSNNVTATWKPAVVTGKITSYRVAITQAGKTVKYYYTKDTKATFSNLKANTDYKVYVRTNVISNDGTARMTSASTTNVIKTKA